MFYDEEGRPVNKLRLSEKQKEEVLARCFRMVNCVNEMALNNLVDFIHNLRCPMAKQVLLNTPEQIVLKVFEQALHDIKYQGARTHRGFAPPPGDPTAT